MLTLTRPTARLDLPMLQVAGERTVQGAMVTLSQDQLNALGLPISYIDAEQRFRFVNRAFLEWTGKPHDEIIGREIIEIDGREIYQLYQAYVDAALGGERVSFERRFSSSKRNTFWTRVDYYPDRGPNGDVRGLLATYTDVDLVKQRELEAGEREHRLRLVTDSVGLPILYFDAALRVRFANRPYGDYIGIAVDDLLGQLLKHFLAPEALSELQRHIEGAFAGATVSYDRYEPRASGEARWVGLKVFPGREAGGAFAVISD